MNRLILIGNGFDLAHGLKTGYTDFIKWYLEKYIKLSHVRVSDEGWLKVKNERYNAQPIDDITVKNIVDYWFKDKQGLISCLGTRLQKEPGYIDSNYYKIEIKSKFIEELFKKCSNNSWVDIENEYYEMLKSISSPKNNSNKKAEIIELNNSLKSLIKELEEYLSFNQNCILIEEYKDIFKSIVSDSDLIKYSAGRNKIPSETMVLNFNYTQTVDNYIKDLKEKDSFIINSNYIHGKLNDSNNPIVFGFGDELDEHYDLMEKQRIKEYFEYIKSFWYFKTENYRNLLRFIESDEFQVFVVGHSCGLSDRTMLSMIFEHENCKSIKIFYYEKDGYNNYNDLTIEIARHFKNKAKMRSLIVSKENSRPMPQMSK